MSITGNVSRLFAALCAAGLYACSSGPATDQTNYPTTTSAPREATGLVGPLKDDSDDHIISWVDGQIVKDWGAEAEKRNRAIERYLDDTDPGRAATYGFRSGQ